jgi:hypothetical protein
LTWETVIGESLHMHTGITHKLTSTIKVRTQQIILGNNATNDVMGRVTQAIVPMINRNFNGTKHKLPKFGHRRWKRIEPPLYMDRAEAPSSFFILHQEKEREKFNKGIIVKVKLMNENKIFMCGRNMQHIFQHKITRRSGNNRITNTSNIHT